MKRHPFRFMRRGFLRLWSLLLKDFKLLARSKTSALIVIFGPLLIVGLVGVAFNTTAIQDVSVGVYSGAYSEISEEIIGHLEEEQYAVVRYAKLEQCVASVARGDTNLCLVFSPDISLAQGQRNKITFYVDYSRVNLVYTVMDLIADEITSSTDELSLELTEILVSELASAKTELAQRLSSLHAVLANNEKVSSDVNMVAGQLAAIDLAVDRNQFQLSSLRSVKSELSASNASVGGLNSAISQLEGYVEQVIYDVDVARGTIDSSVNSLQQVGSVAQVNQETISEVTVGVTSVTTGIEGIAVTDAAQIVTPIGIEVTPVTVEQTYLTKLFPTFVALVLMFVALVLSSTLVMNEKETHAYFRNFITPTSDFVFLFSTYLSSLVILFVQFLLLVLCSFFFVKGQFILLLPQLLLPFFLVSSLFIFVGILLGYMFSSRETLGLATLFVVCGSLFFSNTILPLEAVPALVRKLIPLNPFVLAESVFKKVLLFNYGVAEIVGLLVGLCLFALTFFVLAFVALKLSKRSVMTQS